MLAPDSPEIGSIKLGPSLPLGKQHGPKYQENYDGRHQKDYRNLQLEHKILLENLKILKSIKG